MRMLLPGKNVTTKARIREAAFRPDPCTTKEAKGHCGSLRGLKMKGRFGFVCSERETHELLAVHLLDRLLGRGRVSEGDESESARAAGLAVTVGHLFRVSGTGMRDWLYARRDEKKEAHVMTIASVIWPNEPKVCWRTSVVVFLLVTRVSPSATVASWKARE